MAHEKCKTNTHTCSGMLQDIQLWCTLLQSESIHSWSQKFESPPTTILVGKGFPKTQRTKKKNHNSINVQLAKENIAQKHVASLAPFQVLIRTQSSSALKILQPFKGERDTSKNHNCSMYKSPYLQWDGQEVHPPEWQGLIALRGTSPSFAEEAACMYVWGGKKIIHSGLESTAFNSTEQDCNLAATFGN